MADDQSNHDALITQLAGLTGIAPREVTVQDIILTEASRTLSLTTSKGSELPCGKSVGSVQRCRRVLHVS